MMKVSASQQGVISKMFRGWELAVRESGTGLLGFGVNLRRPKRTTIRRLASAGLVRPTGQWVSTLEGAEYRLTPAGEAAALQAAEPVPE